MVKQQQHTRKKAIAGKGLDLGKFKINEIVKYIGKEFIVMSKRFSNNDILYKLRLNDENTKLIIIDIKEFYLTELRYLKGGII